LTESATHWPTRRGLLADGHIAGAQVHDARVAALCRQHGVRELWSADRDFSRFAGLAVVNPMVHAS
jgi:predicted nucleic acid-binding protein